MGIVFLGTPHRGTKTFQNTGMLMAAILKEASIRSDLRVESSVLKDLDDTGAGLATVSDDFAQFARTRGISLVCFFEGRQSNVSKLAPGEKTVIPMVSYPLPFLIL
jgi:hypothetical protein